MLNFGKEFCLIPGFLLQLPERTGFLGRTGVGTVHGGEAEGEALQIVPCVVVGLAVFFNGGEEFPHGAFKAVFEPAAF